MKYRLMLAVLFASPLCMFGSVLARDVIEVPELPKFTVRTQTLSDTLRIGSERSWQLAARRPRTRDESVPSLVDRAGALLPVRKDQSVKLTVRSDHGIPVVMIADGPIHPLDQSLVAPGTEESNALPGNPVAYAIGNEGRAELAIKPDFDAAWQVWVWLLPRLLAPAQVVELPEEFRNSMLEQGYTEEQLNALFTTPAIVRAWEAAELQKGP